MRVSVYDCVRVLACEYECVLVTVSDCVSASE